MNEIDVIVQTLRYGSDIVAEISRGNILNRLWVEADHPFFSEMRKCEGKDITSLPEEAFFSHFTTQIRETLASNKKSYKEYTIEQQNISRSYGVKILPNHPDNNYFFLTAEHLCKDNRPDPPENKWKMALDASGDGVWDMNIPEGTIFFSQKWHDIFGYEQGEIATIADWTAMVHPDDLKIAEQKFRKHSSGETQNYSLELRYRCKDGSYKWILSNGVIIARSADNRPTRFIGTHKDITERKMMADEHSNNVSLLFRLINNLPSGILVTDENKKLVLVNKAFCKMYGIDLHPRDLVGTDTENSLQQDKLFYTHPDELVARIADILEKKQVVVGDELEMKDGRIISRDYIPLAFKENYRGEIWRFTDITQQKNAERRFQEQREFFEHILNSMPTNIATLSADMKILYANPTFIKNDEIREWAKGKTLEEYCIKLNTPSQITEERLKYFNTAVREKKIVEWDERLEGRSGKVTYQLRRFSPIFKPTGELDLMIAYGVDITDRIRAEQALKESLNAFANSFSFSGIGKALIGIDGKWMELNPVFCQMVGYEKEELLGMNPRDILYEEDADLDKPKIEQLIRKEIDSYTVEKRYVSKTRQIINASVTVSLLSNIDGSPKYFICDITDITAKKILTDELYRQNAELEATKSNLINKIHQLEELSYMIAHNLRGPANNIKMFSERLIMDDNDPAIEDEVFTKDEAGEFVYESSVKLTNSLNTLMELTQIKLNKNIEYNKCDFKSFISDIVNQLHGVVYEKHAQINVNLEVPTIMYPKVYLESILYNLISNALKYSNPEKPPVIDISTKPADGKVCLTVKDNGLGIDLEVHKDKVFKLNKVFHKGFDSKGVGLFLTKSQIESLDGSITVQSKPYEGCEFIAIL